MDFNDIRQERLNCAEVHEFVKNLQRRLVDTVPKYTTNNAWVKLHNSYYPTFAKLGTSFVQWLLAISVVVFACIYILTKWCTEIVSGDTVLPMLLSGVILIIVAMYFISNRLLEHHFRNWFSHSYDVFRIYFSSATFDELFVKNTDGTISPTFNFNEEYIKTIETLYPCGSSYHKRFLRNCYSVFELVNDKFTLEQILKRPSKTITSE